MKTGMKRGLLLGGFLGIFLISLVSAYSFGGYYGGWNVESFLDNPTFVFIGVFAIVFALCYAALLRFFTKTETKFKGTLAEKKEKVLEHRGAVLILALAIAFFSASAAVRSDWVMQLFGDAVFGFLLIILAVVMLILLVPFYKALEKNLGVIPAAILFVLALWGILKYLFNPVRLQGALYNFNIDYWVYDAYDLVSSIPALIVALAVGIAWALIVDKKKK